MGELRYDEEATRKLLAMYLTPDASSVGGS
jgi:hypothetical protein